MNTTFDPVARVIVTLVARDAMDEADAISVLTTLIDRLQSFGWYGQTDPHDSLYEFRNIPFVVEAFKIQGVTSVGVSH